MRNLRKAALLSLGLVAPLIISLAGCEHRHHEYVAEGPQYYYYDDERYRGYDRDHRDDHDRGEHHEREEHHEGEHEEHHER